MEYLQKCEKIVNVNLNTFLQNYTCGQHLDQELAAEAASDPTQ